jgi:hypothetical protein
LDDFKEGQEGNRTNLNIAGSVGSAKWKAPSPGWAKVNCDAALNYKDGRMGGGVVIRDSQGGKEA